MEAKDLDTKDNLDPLVSDVMMLNGTLHYSTRTERGSDIGFSSCTVPNYLVLLSKYFGCILGTLRILTVSGEVQEFGSKSGTGALSRERGA